MDTTRWTCALALLCTAFGAATVIAATATNTSRPAPRAAAPQIAGVTPAQMQGSMRTESITVTGSGFDSGSRVELMFGVGSGANEWRLPRHGYQVLGPSQIRVTVMPGTDADNLRIRVVSASGVSNLGNVRIVAPAPAPAPAPAAVQRPTIPPPTITMTPQVRNVTPQPATTQSAPALNLPAPNTTRSMATAGSTPPTLPPSQSASLPRPITYCGSPNWQRGLLQLAEVEQAVIGGYSFDVACQAHDACYRDCKRRREDCDIQLRTDAEATCATARVKSNCATDVKWFYQVVSSRGQPAFDQARASCPISPVASNLTNQLSKPASQPATAIAPTSPVARPPVPQIAGVNPAQVQGSMRIETITVNGSGFDSGARVELMFGVGSGANEWRLPKHGFQVLSPSQIRVTVMPGADNDRLRIRVVSTGGASNEASVSIVAPTPAVAQQQTTASPTSGAVATAPTQTRSTTPSPTSSTSSAPASQPLLSNVTNSLIPKKHPAPTLTKIQPASGAPGITLTLYGSELSPAGSLISPKIVFNTRPATSYPVVRVVSNNELQVTVPAGESSASMFVETAGGKSSAFTFTYRPPVVTGVSPTSGRPGQSITITGENFGVKQAIDPSTFVKFGDSMINPIQWEDRKIVVTAPSDYGTGVNWKIPFDSIGCFLNSTDGNLILKLLPSCTDLAKDVWKKVKMMSNPGFLDIQVPVFVRTAAGSNGQGSFTYRIQTVTPVTQPSLTPTPSVLSSPTPTNTAGSTPMLSPTLARSAATPTIVTPPTLNSAPPLTGAGSTVPKSTTSTAAPVAPAAKATPKPVDPAITIGAVKGSLYRSICSESGICNSAWNEHLLVGYANKPYKEVVISGDNLDKVVSVSADSGYSVSVVAKPVKNELRLNITANSYDTKPADNLTITLNNNPKLTKALKVIPTFNDYQVYGQCTWYAWHVMRKKNGQGEIISYASGIPMQKNATEVTLPRTNSIIMNSARKHTAYVESVSPSKPTIGSDGSTTTIYTLRGKDANRTNRNQVGLDFTAHMAVTVSKDRKTSRVTSFPIAGTEMTHVYY